MGGLAPGAGRPWNNRPKHADRPAAFTSDPLAAPLSCPCVKGYAQRDYDQNGMTDIKTAIFGGNLTWMITPTLTLTGL